MNRWEYKYVESYGYELSEADLNKLGQAGWEFVRSTSRPSEGFGHVIHTLFKRPLTAEQ